VLPVRKEADVQLLESACRKNALRFIVVLAIAFLINQLDRNSIAYAGLTMNKDLRLTATQFGWAAGMTIITYSLFEVPSNLFMQRIGARLWLSRIMITWGLVASAMAFVVGPNSLYGFRLLLGMTEAGFFPGVLMFASTWFPAEYRARPLAWVLLAIPASSLIGGPLAGALLELNGAFGLTGWQWMFLAEGVPAILIGLVSYHVLVDNPREASWLTTAERNVLLYSLSNEHRDRPRHDFAAALKDMRVYVLTIIQFGFTLGSYGIGIWLPLILKEHELTNMEIGLLSMPPYFIASVAMLIWVRHVDRHGRRVLHLVVSFLLAVGGLVASVMVTALIPSLLALTVALVGVTAARTIFWTIPQKFLAGRAAAGGLAFINSIGMLGGLVGPIMMGSLRDLTGSFASGLLAMAGVLLLATGCAASLRFLIKET